MILVCGSLLMLPGCRSAESPQAVRPENRQTRSSADAGAVRLSDASDQNRITWPEMSDDGVDEVLLIKNINQDDLEYIATELEALTKMITDKGERDQSYWLTADWYTDAQNSQMYQNVLDMGAAAMKPLYLIIYKSPNTGLYEYICAMTLDELSGYDFSNENPGEVWANLKDFLALFDQKVLAERN